MGNLVWQQTSSNNFIQTFENFISCLLEVICAALMKKLYWPESTYLHSHSKTYRLLHNQE